MAKQRYREWNRLRGAEVEVRNHGIIVRVGTVDDVMEDSSAIWLVSQGCETRQLFEAGLGYEIWVEPRLLRGRNSYRMTASALYGPPGDLPL